MPFFKLKLTPLPQTNPVCHLPAETGPCRAAFHRYHFNTNSRSCESFIYGGCHGNQNNFETLEECETQCGQSETEPTNGNLSIFNMKMIQDKFSLL